MLADRVRVFMLLMDEVLRSWPFLAHRGKIMRVRKPGVSACIKEGLWA